MALFTYEAGVLKDSFSIHTDHLGTPREITRKAGEVVWRWEGEPFGNSPPNEDVDGDGKRLTFNLRFPGQYFDAETGRHYNYFRDYNPATGRYVQSDPIGLAGGMNTFGYVGGDPLTFSDPQGLIALPFPIMPPVAGNTSGEWLTGTNPEMGISGKPIGNQILDKCNALTRPAQVRLAIYAITGIKIDPNAVDRGPLTASEVNWKSKPKFGHTFLEHGEGSKNTARLIDRARGTGNNQGQWLDNQRAAEFLNGIKVSDPTRVRIPEGLGQIIKPDGSIASAEWAIIVPRGEGLRTAYPTF
ncbi:RHS repeat domain-containing protein [Parachitinimonas caeni]|uniref:RHS repeat-associated core domain-containing protein n=1 Tax=Parachitinimonas caeni TaxID=3031301 RepID=A0ABT7E0V8_9NEIS|nr:RHS repeat-associated core domain-containing protein [Parachitinimonas caeni]MDK2125926.1 RHS repeat-associated core domain-containing protein [Parachitinimonas caeni]